MLSAAVDSTMTLAAALAVLVMMAALATAHPAQHKLHQVEITNVDTNHNTPHQELLTSYNPLFIPMLNTSDVQRVIMKASLRKGLFINSAAVLMFSETLSLEKIYQKNS